VSDVREAAMDRDENGVQPRGPGWYVLNARDARWWLHDQMGNAVTFEGDERFPHFGINIQVLQPGQPNCMYHGEEAQEDFLVLAGECLLLIEGEERPLRQWDFVHCPPWAEHVFVGAGDGPCVILMTGARNAGDGLIYPVNEAAARHGASVEQETDTGEVAYERFQQPSLGPYPGDLPD
jgi:uncharacterized cupin superfamily protein